MLWRLEVLGTPILVEMSSPVRSQSSLSRLGSFDQVGSQSASLTTFGEHLGQCSGRQQRCCVILMMQPKLVQL